MNLLAKKVSKKKFHSAKLEAERSIEYCKSIIKHESVTIDSNVKNLALVLGVLFHGVKDFVDLTDIVLSSDWQLDHEKIEKAWSKMWNCKDRVEYASRFVEHHIINSLLNNLYRLEYFFFARFGQGLYCSPELIIEKEICSVCKNDFRACAHIPGAIYDGQRCTGIVEGAQLKTVAIVEHPEDPRCRIWPWKLKDDVLKDIVIMASFRIDEFVGN